MAYNGTVTLTAGITPKNNGDFALVNAHDVYVDDETRLDEALEGVNADIISVSETQPEAASNKLWIVEDGEVSVYIPTYTEFQELGSSKVNEPSNEGTAGQVLTTDGNGGRYWSNTANSAALEQSVNSWLSQNISNPSNPPLDRNLSSTSAAAPADVVGEMKVISDLEKDEIENTVQAISFDNQTGNISRIVHTRNGVTVRTDVFTFGTNTITEVRTLPSGESMTIVTNTSTLQTTVTYSNA